MNLFFLRLSALFLYGVTFTCLQHYVFQQSDIWLFISNVLANLSQLFHGGIFGLAEDVFNL